VNMGITDMTNGVNKVVLKLQLRFGVGVVRSK
jgi:hypothetical protein